MTPHGLDKPDALISQAAMGRVEGLFVKTAHGQPVTELAADAALPCVAGVGLQGDIHANPLSPRQVLVTLDAQLALQRIAPGALHENMVICVPAGAPFQPGAALVTEQGVEIRFTMFCEPCRRIHSLVGDLGAMIHRRGMLGTIVRGGDIRRGDQLTLIPGRYPALPESTHQRFIDAVGMIPSGRLLRYADLALAMGVANSFVRALPGYIKRHAGSDLPVHRIVNAQGKLPELVPNQAATLMGEGVAVEIGDTGRPSVSLARYLWRG